MRDSMLVLAAFLALALALGGDCSVPATETPQTQASAEPASTAATAEPAPQASVRAPLERVLDVVATPAAASAGWELARIEARRDDAALRVSMDVEVRGSDELQVNANFELLLDALRGLEGARKVDVHSSQATEPTWLRLSGVTVEFEAPAPQTRVAAAAEPDLMTSIRNVAADSAVRLGSVDIRRLNDDGALRVSASNPAGGRRLDSLRRFLSELEARHPGARVVRVSFESAWRTGEGPKPDPMGFHWQIEVERGT
jgi:ribosome maturation factor RimP